MLAILVTNELAASASALPESPWLPHVHDALLFTPLRPCPSTAVFHASGLTGVVYVRVYEPFSSVPRLNVAVWPSTETGVTGEPLKLNVAPSNVRFEPMVSVRTTFVALVVTLSAMFHVTVMSLTLTWAHLEPVVLPSLMGMVMVEPPPGNTISTESPSPVFSSAMLNSALSEIECSEGCWRSHSSPYVI